MSANSTQLELRLVGDIKGSFFVPRYQRGYRWGSEDVTRLLEDIWRNGGKPYSLQPVVVKRRAGTDDWELIDGQQRLTTLYLIFLYMERASLQNAKPLYSISYETRPSIQDYLGVLDEERSKSNIDFYHLYQAYDAIRAWFDARGDRRQKDANKIYEYLFDCVSVIWYEAADSLDSTTLFTRLNVGRIPLTDAELVKALLLTRCRELPDRDRPDRSVEIAAQWDGVERDLQNDDVWGFINDGGTESPTRITLLLETLAGGVLGRKRPRFFTFEKLREQIEKDPINVWNRVVDLHALILGWFENRTHYHKVGYLVATGDRFGELAALASDRTKSDFEATLDERIRKTLDLTPARAATLGYDTDSGRDKCQRLLLLMNVETVRRMQGSSERYPFRLTRGRQWSLEHIHARNAEALTKADQWRSWLTEHHAALEALPLNERRTELLLRIDRALATEPLERQAFYDVARDVAAAFSSEESAGGTHVHSVHSISNLALLSSEDNAALNNAVFEVKRRKILELDRAGAFIPVCTRQVFLKYFTGADAQQVHFWSAQDRQSYLAAMIGTEGVVYPYLTAEEQHP